MVSTHTETMRQALEALKYHRAQTRPIHQSNEAIAALERVLAQPQQEPAAKITGVDEYGPMLGWHKHWINFPVGTQLYTSPPAQPEWIPVTQELLNQQHPWLYQPMWIVMKHCSHLSLIQGHYEWQQGRYPDRFLTDIGNVWAFDCTHVMPIIRPALPGAKTD